jgi:hypothetical protein
MHEVLVSGQPLLCLSLPPSPRRSKTGYAKAAVVSSRRQPAGGVHVGPRWVQLLARRSYARLTVEVRGPCGEWARRGDAEVLEHAPQMSRELRAGQLLGDGPMAIVADEQIEPVAVDRQRQAVRREQLLEERGIAVDVLGGPEVQGTDLARRVVDDPGA